MNIFQPAYGQIKAHFQSLTQGQQRVIVFGSAALGALFFTFTLFFLSWILYRVTSTPLFESSLRTLFFYAIGFSSLCLLLLPYSIFRILELKQTADDKRLQRIFPLYRVLLSHLLEIFEQKVATANQEREKELEREMVLLASGRVLKEYLQLKTIMLRGVPLDNQQQFELQLEKLFRRIRLELGHNDPESAGLQNGEFMKLFLSIK